LVEEAAVSSGRRGVKMSLWHEQIMVWDLHGNRGGWEQIGLYYGSDGPSIEKNIMVAYIADLSGCNRIVIY